MFSLYNFTKRERVDFSELSVGKSREFTQSHNASALAAWYCFRNRGDLIAFVSDWEIDGKAQIFGVDLSWELVNSFPDKTEETIDHAIAARVFIDGGWFQIDDDPDPCMRRRRLTIDDREGSYPPDGLWPSPLHSSARTDGR